MTEAEFFLALASAEKVKATTETAIVLGPRGEFIAIGTGGSSGCETAIANVLHGAKGRLDDHWIVATYEPTALCLGMANILGITSVGFLDSTKRVVDAGRSQDVVKLRALPAGNIELFQSKPKTGIPNWTVAPDQFLAALNGEFTQLKTAYQNDIKSFTSAHRYTSRVLDDRLQTAFTTVPGTAAPTAMSLEQRDLVFMRLAYALVGQSWNPVITWDTKDASGERFGGNNVGVVIVHQNRVIGWGINIAAENPVLHAESACILAYLKAGNVSLPHGSMVYSTLQPCKMCAGMIVGAGANIEVIFGAGDFNIKTVLSGGARPNGCSERKPKVAGDNPFSFAEAWIEGRLRENRALAQLEIGGGDGSAASTRFLRDDTDVTYRTTLHTKAGFNPQQQRQLAKLEENRQLHLERYPVKKGAPLFGQQKQLEQLQGQRDAMLKKRRALADNYAKGNFGNKYVSFADTIVSEWRRLKDQPDSDERRAYAQCIEVLKTVAVQGLTTNYGMNFVNAFFADFA